MTEERRLKLESQLDEALATGDHARVDAVRRTIDRETLECTAHTADRIKRIERRTETIESKVGEIADHIRQYQARIEGAKLLWRALRYLAAAGSGAGALWVAKILQGGTT